MMWQRSADDAMNDEDADGDEEPLPIPKAAGKKAAASEPKTKEKLFKVRRPAAWPWMTCMPAASVACSLGHGIHAIAKSNK